MNIRLKLHVCSLDLVQTLGLEFEFAIKYFFSYNELFFASGLEFEFVIK